MKVSAINTMQRVYFNGESTNSKKNLGALKNTAGAAMIALAAAVPAQEADAQYFVPVYPHVHYYVPMPEMKVPNCFVYGDVTNENYEKTMPDVFTEIDREIYKNGQISVNEVVSLEEYNHNSTAPYPMSRAEKLKIANLVKSLSRKYNESDSNPNTINYNEYSEIMSDYMKSKNAANFMNLLQILVNPYYYGIHPYYPHRHLPPHHHYR